MRIQKVLARALLLSILLGAGLGLTGCEFLLSRVIDSAVSGESIKPLGNNQYRVSYDGHNPNEPWLAACSKACQGKKFRIIEQNAIPRGKSDEFPGWTGIIQCLGEGESESAVSSSGAASPIPSKFSKSAPPSSKCPLPGTEVLFNKLITPGFAEDYVGCK
jgi:hypothetical protein